MINVKEIIQRTITDDVIEGTVKSDSDGEMDTFLFKKIPAQELFAKTLFNENDKIDHLERCWIDPDTRKPYPREIIIECIKKSPLIVSRIHDVILIESLKYHDNFDKELSKKKKIIPASE